MGLQVGEGGGRRGEEDEIESSWGVVACFSMNPDHCNGFLLLNAIRQTKVHRLAWSCTFGFDSQPLVIPQNDWVYWRWSDWVSMGYIQVASR
jgi:hypothetical protein